jgi:hypothetical protein
MATRFAELVDLLAQRGVRDAIPIGGLLLGQALDEDRAEGFVSAL